MIDCPVCHLQKVEENKCPQCDSDLTPLLRLRALPETYYLDGAGLEEQGNLDEAIEKFSAAVSLNPRYTAAHLALGRVLARKALYDEAVDRFQKVLEIEPANDEAKKAGEEAAKAGAESNDNRKKVSQGVAGSKKLLIGVPLAAFFLGMVLLLLIQDLSTKEQQADPPEIKIDYQGIAREITIAISRNPELTGMDIEVEHEDEVLIILGSVPSSVHKKLVIETVKNISQLKKINTEGLLISPLPEKEVMFSYTVKRNDTLSLIAYRFYNDGLAWEKIYRANMDRIRDQHDIYTGQVLLIPLNQSSSSSDT